MPFDSETVIGLPAGVTAREGRIEDIPQMVAIDDQYMPEDPGSVELWEHFWRTFPKDKAVLDLAAEADEGTLVAYCRASEPVGVEAEGAFNITVWVDPAWTGRGIGGALYRALEAFTREQGAKRLWAQHREDWPRSEAAVRAAGFLEIGRERESSLDVESFDPRRFESLRARLEADGIEFTTLAKEMEARDDAVERLYEMAHAAEADQPMPEGARVNETFDEWRRGITDSPASDPGGIVIAKDGDRYVGYTALWFKEVGDPGTSMTAVHPDYRRRGIATLVKVDAIAIVRGRGYKKMRTSNYHINDAMLAVNKKLGYVQQPGWIVSEKRLGEERG